MYYNNFQKKKTIKKQKSKSKIKNDKLVNSN